MLANKSRSLECVKGLHTHIEVQEESYKSNGFFQLIQKKRFNCHVPFQHLQHKSLKALLDSPMQAPHRSPKTIWRAPLLSLMLQLAETCSKRMVFPIVWCGISKSHAKQHCRIEVSRSYSPNLKLLFQKHVAAYQLVNQHDAWEYLTSMTY